MDTLRTRVLLAGTALLLAAVLPLHAMHPNLPLGFDPERAYQQGLDRLDQVDLYSGRLSVVIPLGPFAITYGSNVWRYQTVLENNQEKIRADPDSQATGGLGWHLGLGEVYRPEHPYNDTGHWLYVGDDGGRHTFYTLLHTDDGSAQSGVWYTRDGSYLRMTKSSTFYLDIEAPDGTTRRFLTGAASDPTVFRLHKVWSRFTSAEDPDLWVVHNAEDTLRTIYDRYGRHHDIHLTDAYSRFDRVVTMVDAEGFGGQRAIYTLSYTQRSVDVSCKDTSSATPHRITVPLLREVGLPDGTAYRLFEGATPMVNEACAGGIQDLPGTLTGLDLPTGGKLRFSYQEYEFPTGEANSPFNASAGVADRRMLRADGSELGRWTYKSTKVSAAATGGHPEMHTEVVSPGGDCAKHFFDAVYWTNSGAGEGWERGLPFVTSEQHGGRNLSSQVWTAAAGGGSCTGTKLRSTYLSFRRDTLPGPSAPKGDWYQLNRQPSGSRVVFHDDGDRWADTQHSDFDGLGHFRRTVTTGNFVAGSTSAERREVYVHYNRVSGSYPGGGYQPPAPTEPWVLGIFDYRQVSEDEAAGATTVRTEYGFEPVTGFLACSRVLADGVGRSAGDLLTVFARDGLGQVSDVKRYGGDQQALAVTGADCGTVPAAPAYWTHHTYQYGALRSSRPRTPQGVDGPFATYDTDLDPSTGEVVNQRDTAGVQVTFDRDAMGRLTSVVPQVGAQIHYAYTQASGTLPASISMLAMDQGGSAVLAEQETVFDAFGRRCRERRKMPGGGWSEQVIERDARGRVTLLSEPGAPSLTTTYEHDPFGRETRVRPPDGPDHDLVQTQLGNRLASRQVKIALAGGETYVSKSYEYDRYARLRRVSEPSGPGGALVDTTYRYDVAGRLTSIVTGSGPTQTRTFSYDNRGFQVAETHPEKGAAGNGTVLYQDFDAAGLPGRVIDGPHDLLFEYDFMGRRTMIRDHGQGDRIVTQLLYDNPGGYGMGKLWQTRHHNYLDLPWNAQGEEDVQVRQVYTYYASGGRISQKKTRFVWSLPNVSFRQAFGYDDLGNLSTQTYPDCALSACDGTDAETGRQLTYHYDQGLLTGVDGWTAGPGIEYHPSGMWHRIHHANGVTDHQLPTAQHSGWTGQRYTTGASPAAANVDSGPMTYDGAGNVTAIGGDTFTYDHAGRLAEAAYFDGDYRRSYQYDAFGNLTARTVDDFGWVQTTTYQVDPATNRLSGAATYDSAGNLTSWGGWQFTYDTGNRVARQAHMFYLYDAAGERVASIPNVPSWPVVRFHLRDLGERLVSTLLLSDDTWSRERDHIWAGNRRLAWTDSQAGSEHHVHADHLGSPRLVTRADGTAWVEHRFMPFGEEPWETASDDSIRFTGHERDFSYDTDYMHARHYASQLGRFLSTDPVTGSAFSPQSFNRYAYGMNNPLRYRDPDGRSNVDYKKLSDKIGPLAILVWIRLDSPMAKAEKAMLYGAGAGVGLAATAGVDIFMWPLRSIPAVNEPFEKMGGPGSPRGGWFPLTGQVYDGLEEGAQRFLGFGNPGDHGDSDAGAADDVVIDPQTGRPIVIDDEITVIGQAGTGGEATVIGDEPRSGTHLICGDFSCLEVTGASAEQRALLRAELRGIEGLQGLATFRCMVQPILCGTGNRGGGPSIGGFQFWR